MNIGQLKELIKNLPDDTKIRLHVWTNEGSLFYALNHAVNFNWQRENKIFLLTNAGILDTDL